MKLATLRRGDDTVAVRIEGEMAYELGPTDVKECLCADEWIERYSAVGESSAAWDESALAAVIPSPSKILCLGLNYRGHIREMGRPTPEFPTVFPKFADALVGPRDPIVIPSVSQQVDWEAELAVVIGRTILRADRAEAKAAIAGFTVMNDISMRDWQVRTTQWFQGKTFERSTPLGPWLVTPDEVDWAQDLLVRCVVDGEVVQEARTSEHVFGPAEAVSYVSMFTRLSPGDVIALGTPSGVGVARTPPRFLQSGQVVRTEIEGIGALENRCIAEVPDP